MRMFGNRTIVRAAAVSAAVVVSLGSGGGALASPEVAAGTVRFLPAAVSAGADDPVDLKAALLTTEDLPKGYAALDADLGADMIIGMFDKDKIGGDPCKPAGKGRAAGGKVPVEVAGFIKGPGGPVLLESLAGTGRKLARELVRDTTEMLERCPTVRSGALTMVMSPMPKVAEFGDESVAVSVAVTVKNAETEVSVEGKMVVAAQDDVYATVVMVGDPAPETRELKKITKAALRKLAKAV